LDGVYEAEGDPPMNFVELWNGLILTNDMVNPNTGDFDPRHLYGTSNQDVFRWPSIKNGTEKEVLALYIIYLLMPGAPLLTWGEEQAFYVLENTNANYCKINMVLVVDFTDNDSIWSVPNVIRRSMAIARLL
jgi:alpha-1,3-glucan synthase